MTAIYLLDNGQLKEADALAERIRTVTGERYAVERAPDIESLRDNLGEWRQVVIFFSSAPEAMAALVHQCRTVLPGSAFIALVEPGQTGKIDVLEIDCHFLEKNCSDFALLNQISTAVRQAELLSTVSDSAQLDEVTNLFNRRYFIQRLGEEMSLAKRHLSPLCVVALGISFYQMYLDSYGYDFINALLRYMADKTGTLIRHEDIVARIGDDEIGILLPRSTEKGAKVFTNRLLLNLNASTFKYGGYEEELSVCAGVAGFPLPDDTGSDSSKVDADTVIRYARHALHQAKCGDEEHVRMQLFSEIKPVI